jgi:hypothetical protein
MLCCCGMYGGFAIYDLLESDVLMHIYDVEGAYSAAIASSSGSNLCH